MKLVDKDAAFQAIDEFDRFSGTSLEIEDVDRILNELPEVDPIHAAGACRCSECKHAEIKYPCQEVRKCTRHNRIVHMNWFCAHGRPKEEP